MSKQKLYRFLVVLAMLVCMLMIWSTGSLSAHASAIPNHTTTKTQIIQAPAKLCTFLKKSVPTTFGSSQGCEFKYTSTDVVYTQNSSAQPFIPNSCGPATVAHTASYVEIPGIWGFSLTTTFHWNSMCANVTSIINEDCHSMWALPGFTVSPNRCIQYGGGGAITAEDDINYGSYVGGTGVASLFSEASSYLTITDWWA